MVKKIESIAIYNEKVNIVTTDIIRRINNTLTIHRIFFYEHRVLYMY